MTITIEQAQAIGICFIMFYIVPVAICYTSERLMGDKINWEMVLVSVFNCFSTIFCVGIIIEHFFPSRPGPLQTALEKIKEDMENGEYGRRERSVQYIQDFIDQKGLRDEYNDYVDAMEMARKFQHPDVK